MKILASYFLAVMMFLTFRTVVPYTTIVDSIGEGVIISALAYLIISAVWTK